MHDEPIIPEEPTWEEPPPEYKGPGDRLDWVEPDCEYPLPGEPLPAPRAPLVQRLRVLILNKEWLGASEARLLELVRLVDPGELAFVLDLSLFEAKERIFGLVPSLRNQPLGQGGVEEIELIWRGLGWVDPSQPRSLTMENLEWFSDQELSLLLDFLEPYERWQLTQVQACPAKERIVKKFLLLGQGLLQQRGS
jgi:hypothetical protein